MSLGDLHPAKPISPEAPVYHRPLWSTDKLLVTFICLDCFPTCTAQLRRRGRDKNLHAGRASFCLIIIAVSPACLPQAPAPESIPAASCY